MPEELTTLSVSDGNVFVELPRFDPLKKDKIVPKRTHRTRKRDTIVRAVQKRFIPDLVQRKTLRTSKTVFSIGDGKSLNINATLTDTAGALWLLNPDMSFYIDQVTPSNQWPNGAIFTASSGKYSPNSYSLFWHTQEAETRRTSSTDSPSDSVIFLNIRFQNNSGATVPVGTLLGMRYIINNTAGKDVT